jgi:FdhD protein
MASDLERHREAVREVRARRICTRGADPRPVEEDVAVVCEAPVVVDVEGLGTYTLLCTPHDRRALAVGFLRSEGVIETLADLEEIRLCKDDPNCVRVRLVGKPPVVDEPERHLLITSSCGACGTESIEARIAALPRVGQTLRMPGRLLPRVRHALRERQGLFQACGGTHAVGLFDVDAAMLDSAEDAGRHNALDKAIGHCLMAGRSTVGLGAALSGRVSLEMVGKCARAGIELITAISAPTTLAIDVAQRCGITLCAFVREERATLFTHAGRVLG